MKLLIAIPALDEEQSIGSTIERCLAAGARICAETAVTSVDVTVISDGSTDRTVEIARTYADRIDVIVFDKNQGYGAAIKEGWRHSDAELLAFLDADGTCDPEFFVPLCETVIQDGVEVALGCRCNDGSDMPRVRRIGNRVFAILLRTLSSRSVRDTASGMRVVRREALPRLYPLPDGLHFTPAMSARALLSTDVRLAEIDMPYHDREGKSKLRVGRDGLRFFQVIVKTGVLFRPSRVLGLAAIPFLLAGLGLLALPVADGVTDGSLPSGVRGAQAAAGVVLLTAAALLGCAGYLAGRIVEVVLQVHSSGWSQRFLHGSSALVGSGSSLAHCWRPDCLPALLGAIRNGEARGLFTMVVARNDSGPRRSHTPVGPVRRRRGRTAAVRTRGSRRTSWCRHDPRRDVRVRGARTTRCSQRASGSPVSRRSTSSTAASTARDGCFPVTVLVTSILDFACGVGDSSVRLAACVSRRRSARRRRCRQVRSTRPAAGSSRSRPVRPDRRAPHRITCSTSVTSTARTTTYREASRRC